MFIEKHWVTLLLIAVLVCLSANTRAAPLESERLNATPFMVEEFDMGPGQKDVTRYYDGESRIVCYYISTQPVVFNCQPGGLDLHNKYKEWKKVLETRKALEAALGK